MLADAGPVAMLEAWVNAHPRYAYTVDALERDASGTGISARLRITVDAAQQTQVVRVVRGKGAGSDIAWSGGDSVVVRGPGLAHLIAVRMDVRDPRILSPRHNDVRSGLFSRVAQCYADHAAHVRDTPLGRDTQLTLTDERGVACGPEYGDAAAPAERITTDRITIDAEGTPLVRERLSGATVVERWAISELTFPT